MNVADIDELEGDFHLFEDVHARIKGGALSMKAQDDGV
jgi:hypothetical protein